MDWQKYPKSRKSIRIKQTQTLEIKECPTFPEMGATSKLSACNSDVEARTRAKTSESAGPGPGNPSGPEGPCRRRHGQRGGCCWPCAGRQAPASRWRAIPSTESALHQRWWCSGMNCRAVCMRFRVRNVDIIFILPILIY